MRAFVVVVALGAALPVQAQSQLQLQQQSKGDSGSAKPPLPMHVNLSLTQSVGSGTFVQSPFNPTVSTSLTINPLIAWQGFTFLINQGLGLEWTQSDTNSSVNQIEMNDTVFIARYMRLRHEELNLMFLPGLAYRVPLSMGSRQAGSLGTASASGRGIWNLPDAGLSFYGQAVGSFAALVPSLANRFLQNEVRPLQDRRFGALTPVTCNPRNANELLSYGCNDGLLPSQWNWGAGVGGAWNGLDGQLSVNLDLGYGQGFSVFTGPDDQFTANRAVSGLVPRQTTSGNLSISYVPTSWLFLTVGASSFQPALSADGTSFRFPLWDFTSPYNNFSQVYFDTTVSL
jgi:hypothetical protein